MTKQISVVIPVYNTKPNYIATAVNSVLNQTYDNLEIIVVNDGSTDSCTISYLQSLDYSKIKVINQGNKGVGGARNTGISHASGEYIGFLDPDDWVDHDFYEVLLKLCCEHEAEISCGVLMRVKGDYQFSIDHFEDNIAISAVEKMNCINNGSTCSKLFNKKLFENIRYKEHTYYEDNPVLVNTMLTSNKVVFTTSVNYYYRENFDSICLGSDKESKRVVDKLYILRDIYDIIAQQDQQVQDAVLKIFVPILIDERRYRSQTYYRQQVKDILLDEESYQNYLRCCKLKYPIIFGKVKELVKLWVLSSGRLKSPPIS